MLVRKFLLLLTASAIVIFSNLLSFIHETDASNHNHRKPTQQFRQLTQRPSIESNRNYKISHRSSSNLSESSLLSLHAQQETNNYSFHNLSPPRHQESQEDDKNVSDDSYYTDEPNQNLSPSRRYLQHNLPKTSSQDQASRIIDNSIKKETPNCATCEQQNRDNPTIVLRERRLEYIKQQILLKLSLREPPSVESIPESIQQVLHNYPAHQQLHKPENHQENFEDNSDRKTEQIVLFPEVEAFCGNSNSAVCFTFSVPKELHRERVRNAELWVYTMAPILQGQRHYQFAITEMSNLSHPTYRQQVNGVPERWVKLNVTGAVSNWSLTNFSVRTNTATKVIRIVCETCHLGIPIDISSTSRRGFLIVNMADSVKKKRRRRSEDCSDGSSQCCRERLVVDFNEIDWNFIIEPRKYDAFFCKGSCLDIHGNVPHAHHHHVRVRQELILKDGITNRTQPLVPCCAATKMSAISLLYLQSNGTVIRETLHNMVVESCGCH